MRELLNKPPSDSGGPLCAEQYENSYEYGSARSACTSSQPDNSESCVSASPESSWNVDKQINFVDSSTSTTVGESSNEISYTSGLVTPKFYSQRKGENIQKAVDNGNSSLFYQELFEGSNPNFDMLFYNNSPLQPKSVNKNDSSTSDSCNSLKNSDDDNLQELLLLTPQISPSYCPDSTILTHNIDFRPNKPHEHTQYNSLSDLFLNANELSGLSPFTIPFEDSNGFTSSITHSDANPVSMSTSIIREDNNVLRGTKFPENCDSYSSRNKRNISLINFSSSKKEKTEVD